MKHFKLFFIFFLILSLENYSKAQNSFSASASSTTVAAGEQFQVYFSFDGNGQKFQAPDFKDFNVLSGPNPSSSVQIINGSMSQSIVYTYIVQAVREGSFKIGVASIEANGKRYSTNPLSINVVKGNPQNKSNNSTGNNENTGGVSKDQVFVRASISKSNVYKGEGFLVTYKLYTKVDLVNYSISKMPSLEGFFSQDIENPTQLQFKNEVMDGVNYKSAEIKKVILFPQRTGTLTIDAMQGEVVARIQMKRKTRSNDPFADFFNDSFFGNSTKDVKVPLNSESLKVNVKELPGNTPSDFTGAVGNFSIDYKLDKTNVKANDAINLKIKISGNGNLKLMDPPIMDIPKDFEKYDPKINSNINVSPTGVSGTKTFEYLLIPRNAGEFKIKISEFSYFDPGKNKYQIKNAEEIIVHVEEGVGGASSSAMISSNNQREVQILGNDIRYIKTNLTIINTKNNKFFGSFIFYVLWILPLLLFCIFLFFSNKIKELNSNAALMKSRKASKVALKRLAVAKGLISNQNNAPFLNELFKALWGFVVDKLQISIAELNKENVQEKLKGRLVKEELINQFISILNNCEMAHYSGNNTIDKNNLYKMAFDVITQLEEEIK